MAEKELKRNLKPSRNGPLSVWNGWWRQIVIYSEKGEIGLDIWGCRQRVRFIPKQIMKFFFLKACRIITKCYSTLGVDQRAIINSRPQNSRRIFEFYLFIFTQKLICQVLGFVELPIEYRRLGLLYTKKSNFWRFFYHISCNTGMKETKIKSFLEKEMTNPPAFVASRYLW
jgi:hypothetical protein